MLPLRHAVGWRIAGGTLLVFVLVATMLPAAWVFPTRTEFLSQFAHVDKWLHGITFVFLAVWFAGQYRPRSYWRIGLGLMLLGFLIEVCQSLVAYRTADWLDIAADVAGIILGLTIATAGLGGWSLRAEQWYWRRMADPGVD